MQISISKIKINWVKQNWFFPFLLHSSLIFICTFLDVRRLTEILPKHRSVTGCCASIKTIGKIRWISIGNKYQANCPISYSKLSYAMVKRSQNSHATATEQNEYNASKKVSKSTMKFSWLVYGTENEKIKCNFNVGSNQIKWSNFLSSKHRTISIWISIIEPHIVIKLHESAFINMRWVRRTKHLNNLGKNRVD